MAEQHFLQHGRERLEGVVPVQTLPDVVCQLSLLLPQVARVHSFEVPFCNGLLPCLLLFLCVVCPGWQIYCQGALPHQPVVLAEDQHLTLFEVDLLYIAIHF
jgi:hypothetical protein